VDCAPLKDILAEYSLQDIFSGNKKLIVAANYSEGDSENRSRKLIKALLCWQYGSENACFQGDTLETALVLLLELENSAGFIKEFMARHDEAPAYASAMKGVLFCSDYFTRGRLEEHYSKSLHKADRVKKEIESALEAAREACESECEQSCKEALSSLREYSKYANTKEEQRQIKQYLGRLRTSNRDKRKNHIKRLGSWQNEMLDLMRDYVGKIIQEAETPRPPESLIDHWCVTPLDGMQGRCVVGGSKRKRFEGSAQVFSAVGYCAEGESIHLPSDFELSYEVETVGTERFDKDVQKRLLQAVKHVQIVENVLNALDNLDEMEHFASALRQCSEFNVSSRLIGLCSAFRRKEIEEWRERLLDSMSGLVYCDIANEIARISPDKLVVAKAAEVRSCGELIEEGKVVFCGRILSAISSSSILNVRRAEGTGFSRASLGASFQSDFSDLFKGEAFVCEKIEPHFGVSVKAKLDYDINQYISGRCRCKSVQGYGWIGEDGKEYVSIYKIDDASIRTDYDREWRCYDTRWDWEEIEEVIARWAPARWAVESVDWHLGSVRLRPLDPLPADVALRLERIANGVESQRVIVNVPEYRMLHRGQQEKLDFDPSASAFESARLKGESLFLLEAPWEFIVNYEEIFLGEEDDRDSKKALVAQSREEAARILAAKQEKERKERERVRALELKKANKKEYKKALKLIKPYEKITAADVSAILKSSDEAKRRFCRLHGYKKSQQFAKRISQDWKREAEIGTEVILGDARWAVFSIEEKGRRTASLISLESVAEFAYRDAEVVPYWANKKYFLKLFSFEQVALNYWDPREGSLGRDEDRYGTAVNHFWLPSLDDYLNMPQLVKQAIERTSGNEDWWLFTNAVRFFGSKAYYVKSGSVNATRFASAIKGIHLICRISLA